MKERGEEGSVAATTLLGRIGAAGLMPGGVAAWRIGEEPSRLVCHGRARLGPVPEPVTPAHWFDLASLTKPLVTATLTLLARRKGSIRLGTRVGDVLEGCAGIGRATVLELLTHTSGLPAWLPVPALAEGDASTALERLVRLEPATSPGSTVTYSCIGYILLGAVLERCTGAGLAMAFTDLVARPLGLADELAFRPDPAVRSLVAGSVDSTWERRLAEELGWSGAWIPRQEPGLPNDGNARFLGGAAGNAGLFGTVAGVLALAATWMQPGVLLTDEEIELATEDHTPECAQARGLGWQLASTPGCSAGSALSPTAFGHTGFTGTSLWIDPEQRAVLVLLGNRHHPNPRPVDLHPARRRFHHLVCAGSLRG